jgi:hypothetical protein
MANDHKFDERIFGTGCVGVRQSDDEDPAKQLQIAADIIMSNIHWPAATEDSRGDSSGWSLWHCVYRRLMDMSDAYKAKAEKEAEDAAQKAAEAERLRFKFGDKVREIGGKELGVVVSRPSEYSVSLVWENGSFQMLSLCGAALKLEKVPDA